MFTERRLAALPKPIAALADVPQLSAEALKQYFDGNAEALRLSVNGLADDGTALDAKVEGIVTQTYSGTIHESMLDESLAEKLNAKADQSALADAISEATAAREQADTDLLAEVQLRAVLQVGSYTGDGTANRVINLGYQPKAVLLTSESGITTYLYSGAYYCFGGLALPGVPVYTNGDTSRVALTIVSNGFQVTCVSNQYLYTNQTNNLYRYLALR